MENQAPVAEKHVINCPKCGTALYVKVTNKAFVCPVCAGTFRVQISERLVKDISRKKMVEAYVTVDKDASGTVSSDSVVNEIKD